MWLYFLVIAGVVALDQATKWLVMLTMELHESIPFLPNVFHFTYIRNEGSAFGMFAENRWVFLILSTVGIAAVLFYLIKFRPKEKLMWIPLSMIAGGGIGNMIDRLYLGYVVDFIDVRLINFAVFNVADSFVTVGAFLFMGYMIYDTVQEYKREKAAKEQEEKQNDAEN